MAEQTHEINTLKDPVKKKTPMTRVNEMTGTDASKYPTKNKKRSGRKIRVKVKK